MVFFHGHFHCLIMQPEIMTATARAAIFNITGRGVSVAGTVVFGGEISTAQSTQVIGCCCQLHILSLKVE